MSRNKLFSLLQTFSKYDLNRFRKFLLSPYFNDHEDLVHLFEIINHTLRVDPEAIDSLEKEDVWKRLYPKRKFDDAHLRRLSSELHHLALRFLVEEARKQDPLSESLELQRILEKPELQKHLTGVERQIRKQIQSSPRQSTWYYLAQFQMNWNIYNRASKVVSTSDFMNKLIPADQSLEHFYIVQKLKFFVAWLIYRGFRSTKQELEVIPGFWEYIQLPQFQSLPLVRIYQNVIQCLTKPDEEYYFNELLKNLEKFESNLTKEDLRECYYIAQNYCAFKVNQGKTEYYQVFFGLFKSIIKLGILLENGQLSEGVFKNMVTIGLWVGEFGWAEEFISEYVIYLPRGIRDNAKTFALANLYFHQKRYEKVIELLRNVEYSDVVYSLGSKLILLRTYYELGEYLALDSLIDSFRIFLRRNKVMSKSLKREYNSFLNFVKKLTTLDVANPTAIDAFHKQVMAVSSSMPKKWLLDKIEELQKK
ncbi:MAG: hypothetical protein H6565_00330 [Lewinellaceae bacterium]|nr:hypothetical protein [Lewinellaceae bacterium]